MGRALLSRATHLVRFETARQLILGVADGAKYVVDSRFRLGIENEETICAYKEPNTGNLPGFLAKGECEKRRRRACGLDEVPRKVKAKVVPSWPT